MKTAKRTLLARWALVLLVVLALALAVAPGAHAAKQLDEIIEYTVQAQPQQDGSVYLTYTVHWRVLDSDSEGPLEWAQIGIANSHCSDLRPLTDNISSLSLDGNYVRIDFDKSYYSGDELTFSYSLNQSYLYTLQDDGTVTYDFTPGWFESAPVDSMTLLWADDGSGVSAVYSLTPADGGTLQQSSTDIYFVGTATGMQANTRMTVKTVYPGTAFAGGLDTEMQAGNVSSGGGTSSLGFVVAIFGVVLFSLLSFLPLLIFYLVVRWLFRRVFQPESYWLGGFGSHSEEYYHGTGHSHIFIAPSPHVGGSSHGGSGHSGFGGGSSHGGGAGRSSCACACAGCACACACAGGGRAGCSVKNFYGAVLDSKKALAALEKDKKAENHKDAE